MTMSTYFPFIGRGPWWRASALLLGMSSCTRFASELDVPLELDDDPLDTEVLPVEPWGCVSDEAGNPLPSPNGELLEFSIQARDFLSGRTPSNLLIRACYRPDVNCVRPATDWLSPNADGAVTLPLMAGFNGYLEVKGDDEVPTLFVLPAPLSADLISILPDVVTVLPPDALLAFGEASQLELNPGAGIVSINTFDCSGPSGAGVRLEVNTSAVPFSFVDGLPIAGLDTTSDEGSAGFANVLPGLVVVRGYWGERVAPVGLETVLVRAMWVTVGSLMPQYAGSP
jgi:hypothetical protein